MANEAGMNNAVGYAQTQIGKSARPTLMDQAPVGNTSPMVFDALIGEREAAIRIRDGLENAIHMRQHELNDINRTIEGLSAAIGTLESLHDKLRDVSAPVPTRNVSKLSG